MWLPISEFFVWLVIIDVSARLAIRRQVELSRREGLELGDAYGVYPPRDPDPSLDPDLSLDQTPWRVPAGASSMNLSAGVSAQAPVDSH